MILLAITILFSALITNAVSVYIYHLNAKSQKNLLKNFVKDALEMFNLFGIETPQNINKLFKGVDNNESEVNKKCNDIILNIINNLSIIMTFKQMDVFSLCEELKITYSELSEKLNNDPGSITLDIAKILNIGELDLYAILEDTQKKYPSPDA